MENKNSGEKKQGQKAPQKGRGVLIAATAASLLCVAVALFLKHPPKSSEANPSVAQAGDLRRPIGSPVEAPISPNASVDKTAGRDSAPEIQPMPQNSGDTVAGQKPVQPKKDPKPKTDKVVQDPISRVALSLVGFDANAELYWFEAIRDPNLPTSERQDLIDDLNEEGLPDPKHPTEEDLPLLFSRLEILEDLIPWIDGHFEWEEPREDLLNLIALAMGGGHPVN
jgi:hypothetical protein